MHLNATEHWIVDHCVLHRQWPHRFQGRFRRRRRALEGEGDKGVDRMAL